jgi:ABC-type Zn2+ transport system substrate-binding protein/surface adhesin
MSREHAEFGYPDPLDRVMIAALWAQKVPNEEEDDHEEEEDEVKNDEEDDEEEEDDDDHDDGGSSDGYSEQTSLIGWLDANCAVKVGALIKDSVLHDQAAAANVADMFDGISFHKH